MKMKNTFLLGILLFACLCLQAQVFPTHSIINNGPDSNRINFVILPDGYTASELSDFQRDVVQLTRDLLLVSPFREYRSFINFYAIDVPSNQSGASHPGTATDESEPVFSVATVDNYFGSTFDAFSIHRLLVPMNSFNIFTVLATNFPDYDQAFVLVNSPFYGGSGGSICAFSTHELASEISIHEIGHSFASLTDEYWAGDGYAREANNMTRESDPDLVIWKEWLGISEVGIYQHGTSGVMAQWYRPHENCKMRFLGPPFCPVCTEAFIDRIYSLVEPIDWVTPKNTSLMATDSTLHFTAGLVRPESNTLQVQWFLNDTLLSSTDTTLAIEPTDLQGGINRLNLVVIDTTALSKSFYPAAGYVFSRSWEIEIDETTDVIHIETDGEYSRFVYKAFPNPVTTLLLVNYENFSSDKELDVRILDASGRTVQQQVFPLLAAEGQLKLDVANLPKGVYVVYGRAKTFQWSFKLVK